MASEKVVHLTDDSFDEQTGSGYVMIDFWAEWCGPCRALAPVIDSIAESHGEQIKVCKLDVDSINALLFASESEEYLPSS